MKIHYVGKTIHPLKTCREHSHAYWELVYNEKGTGTTFIDCKQYSFEENSIMLYPPWTMHRKTAETQFEDIFVHFEGCTLPPNIYIFPDTHAEPVLSLLKVMYDCYHGMDHSSVCSHLMEAVMGLLVPEVQGMDKNVRQLRHILVTQFANPDFHISDAMAQIPLNEDHLRRRFKMSIGMTPQNYLNQLRIENAKKLLSQENGTGISVAEAAYLSGFYDPLYFSRVFRKYTGVPPQTWMQESRNMENDI